MRVTKKPVYCFNLEMTDEEYKKLWNIFYMLHHCHVSFEIDKHFVTKMYGVLEDDRVPDQPNIPFLDCKI